MGASKPVRSTGSLIALFAAIGSAIALPLFAALSRDKRLPSMPCTFKGWTGIPCPGCRGTRAAISLGRGELAEALTWNPLAVVFLLGIPVILCAVFFGLHHRIHPTARTLALAIVALILLIATNWIYVIRVGG